MKAKQALRLIPAIALVLLASCTSKPKEETSEQAKALVRLETVHLQDVGQTQEFTATVQANIKNRISPQAPNRIARLMVEVGDKVRAGQLLATMDDTSLKQAKIQLANQELEFNRIDELYKVGGVSKSNWDAMRAALDVSIATCKNLEENSRLVSPINGVITERSFDNGDMASGAIYVVEQITPVKLLVHVSETYFTRIKKGMEVDITLEVYPTEVFKGKVNLVYPTVDASSRTFAVEIQLANSDEKVRPGMFSRVVINFGTEEHVVVPDLAIVKQAGSGDRYVYVYNSNTGKVSYEKVELGRRMDDRYEIISGLKDGDQVVIAGQSRLSNGASVEIEK
jgi:RND family efflux transporter, MFP subunit